MKRFTAVSWMKLVVFILCLMPLAALVAAVFTGKAGPNPIEFITDETGETALRLLVLGLALSPLRWWRKTTTPIRFRRMIGLFAFFYAVLHVLTYAVLDNQLDLQVITEDLFKRTYIIAGFASFIILVPLAITSTKGMMRRLGKRWMTLHKGVYVASIAAVLHYIWLARGDQLEPWVYAAVLAILLLLRVHRSFKTKKGRRSV